MSKKIFDKRVDREASYPATATLSSFCLNPADSGRKNCKETILALENRIFCRNNPPVPAVHAAGCGFLRRLRPSHPLPELFDSLGFSSRKWVFPPLKVLSHPPYTSPGAVFLRRLRPSHTFPELFDSLGSGGMSDSLALWDGKIGWRSSAPIPAVRERHIKGCRTVCRPHARGMDRLRAWMPLWQEKAPDVCIRCLIRTEPNLRRPRLRRGRD